MKLRKYSQLKFGLVLAIGAVIALVLCIQCIRTYLYADAVLVPQQAEREAVRQAGALSDAARSAGITDVRELGPVIERSLEAASDRVQWMRVIDLNSNVLAQGGAPEGTPKFPAGWRERVEKHDRLGTIVNTRQGKSVVVLLPFRMPRPPHPLQSEGSRLDRLTLRGNASAEATLGSAEVRNGPSDDRRKAYVLEVAISLKAISGAFAGLRENLILGLIAAIALLVAVAVIGLRAPHYLRGKYLESELRLAKRVQSDLQPKPQSVSAHMKFAACAVAADHVGGDFYDVFEEESGKVAIVLGDVSGKGVPAALLVSVLHGAIRSSTAPQHEFACERISRMLCERTACERFATLFWGVFDPSTKRLRYVNAGHAAPMLVRHDGECVERLCEGGPVLGLLPSARYSAGIVEIDAGDTLIVYSDGVIEAENKFEEEFGEARIAEIVSNDPKGAPETLCERILAQVTAFTSPQVPQDDCTLMIVKFSQMEASLRSRKFEDIGVAAIA